MPRLLALLLLALCAVSPAFAQDVFGGWWELTHGTIRMPDGSTRSAKGLKIPYWVTPVGKTRQIIERRLGRKLDPWTNPKETDSLVRIYENNRSSNYFGGTAEGPMPSALDDYRISPNGVNTGTLDRLTVGWSIPDRNFVFAVMGFYDTFLPGQGAGNSAFGDIIVDSFGGPFAALSTSTFPQIPGEYLITFGQTISSLGITFQDDQAYFFQQFRIGSHTGPFDNDWSMFFSGGGEPQIGASNDSFYYDSDPMDGIYDELEFDHFGGPPFQANFAGALDIESNVTFSDLPAASISIIKGRHSSGNYTSTWSSNNVYYTVLNAIDVDDLYPIGIQATTFAPQANLTSLQFTIESKSNRGGVQQVVAMWNYALNTWMNVNTTSIGTTDSTTTFVITGNVSQFVHPSSLEMKARFDYQQLASEDESFSVSLDWLKWRVGVQ